MRLDSLYINGFGIFHDIRIENISPNIAIFFGDNESGKSTLLSFIRSMLFGFPDGRSHENPYPPLAGGRHGGSINLRTDESRIYRIERYPGTRGGRVEILKPDNSLGGKDLLHRLLGTANKILYKNIYAFSLSELQDFETLNTESVNETLYSAGAGIDPKGLINLKSRLEKIEGDLFKPGGKKPKMNQILSRLTSIRKETKAILSPIEEYDRIKSRINSICGRIQSLEEERDHVSRLIETSQRWLNIRPDWINLSLSERKLNDLEPVESFPSHGVQRLEGLQSRLNDLTDESIRKEDELRRQEAELSTLNIDKKILDHSSSIRRLQKDFSHYDAVVLELASLKQELSAQKSRFDADIMDLGPSWTEEDLSRFNLSITAREDVRSFREKLDQLNKEAERKRDDLNDKLASRTIAQRALNEMEEPLIKDLEILKSMKKSCKELKGLINESLSLRRELKSAEERADEIQEDLEILKGKESNKPYGLPFWPVFLLLLFGGLLLYWLAASEPWRLGLPVIILILLLDSGYLILRSRIQKHSENYSQEVKSQRDRYVSKLESLRISIDQYNRDLDALMQKISSLAVELSISQDISTDLLEDKEEEIQDNINLLDQWNNSQYNLKRESEQYQNALTELDNSDARLQQALDSWDEWLLGSGLEKTLSPDGALETLTLIRSLRERLDISSQLKLKIESLEKWNKEYLDLAFRVLDSMGIKPETSSEIQPIIHNLINEYTETEKASQKRDFLQNELEANKSSLSRINGLIDKLNGEIKDLYDSANTDNEEAFRQKADIFEKRSILSLEIERCRDNIERLSIGMDEKDKVIEKLPMIDFNILDDQLNKQKQSLNNINSELDDLKKEQARLEEQTRFLINDEQISSLRMEEEALKGELTALAEEWITARISQRLIRMARARYEKERQPEVISEAGRYFKKLTNGRYSTLAAPIGENRIEVLCNDNTRKETGHLSRGTAEQLYLALRFGFIHEFSKRSGTLPIIMDEILVNFDAKRAKSAVNSILEFSKYHQILYFTCHPETVSIFSQADENIPCFEISKGVITSPV